MSGIDEDIKSGNFKPVYLLYGEEQYLVRSYRDRLIKACMGKSLPELSGDMNFARFTGTATDPRAVYENSQTMPFFAERRVILIEGSDWFKKSSDEAVKCIESVPESCVIIFTERNVDKRLGTYKTVLKAGFAQEYVEQSMDDLRKWIVMHVDRNHKKITKGALERLLLATGPDMTAIRNELEKLCAYCLYKEAIELADVEEMTQIKAVDRVFEMIEYMSTGRREAALKSYNDLLLLKIKPQKILSLMERQFRILIVIKGIRNKGFNKTELAQTLGVKPFVIDKSISQARHFSKKRLQNALKDAANYDLDIKSGRIPERMAVELLLIKYSEEEED